MSQEYIVGERLAIYSAIRPGHVIGYGVVADASAPVPDGARLVSVEECFVKREGC